MAADRAEVTVVRGGVELTARQLVDIDEFVRVIDRAFGVGRNEPRKEGVARAAQDLSDAPMTRRPRA